MNTVNIEIQGLAELYAQLEGMSEKMQKNIMRGAVRAAAKVIQEAAKARAPVLQEPDERRAAGALRDSIRLMSTRTKGEVIEGGVAAGAHRGDVMTAEGGQGKYKFSPFYALMVEKGTKNMAAHPFMRPAADEKSGEAIEAMKEYIAGRIAEAL